MLSTLSSDRASALDSPVLEVQAMIDPYERLIQIFERGAKLVERREWLMLEIARCELLVLLERYSGRGVDDVNKN